MKRIHLLLHTLAGIAVSAQAGGPLYIEGPYGTTPVTYENPKIVFNLDQGPLGVQYTNDEADQLVRNAIALWNNVNTTSISLTTGTDLPVDVDGSNYTGYIPEPPPGTTIHNDDDGLNPVVYDSTGEIIDDFFGAGQSGFVIGFASSSYFVRGSHFTEGFVVINGRKVATDDDQLTLTIAHEIGHFFGLDHSQADIDPYDGYVCWNSEDSYPLMYPLACRSSYALQLHPDDETSISSLYPDAAFASSHGQVRGTFRTTGNTAIRGANLWVSDTQTGDVFSIVSDYLKQNTGFFSLMLPPGTYTLHANPVNPNFYSGSSVGPYADTDISLSFQPPASTIGFVDFHADGNAVALLTVTAGEAVDVTFYSDGSGTFSGGNTISDPNNQVSSPSVPASDSGIGTLSAALPAIVAMLLAAGRGLRIRRYSRPTPTPRRSA